MAGHSEIERNLTAVEKRETCQSITEELPDWFGIPTANAQYAADAAEFPALALKHDNVVAALLVYKTEKDHILNEDVLNIHWLGVRPAYHHQGMGRKLITALEDIGTAANIHVLSVETLDPELADPYYLRTHAFYESMGFRIFHRFAYDARNCMVRMKKTRFQRLT